MLALGQQKLLCRPSLIIPRRCPRRSAPFGDGSPIITPEIYIPEGAAFNPTSLITGAGGFWRADTGVTGSPSVTAWADQSSFANNLTTSSSPAFSSTGFNSAKPGITFTSNSSQILQNTAVTFAAGATFSAFFLLQKGTGASGFLRYGGLVTSGNSDFTNPSICFEEGNAGGDQWLTDSTGVGSSPGGNGGAAFNLSTNSLYLIGVTLDGTNGNLWVNGAVQGAATGFTFNVGGAGSNTIFCGLGAGNSSGFTLAFFGMTKKAMNSTDWTNLKNFANSNWGTSF